MKYAVVNIEFVAGDSFEHKFTFPDTIDIHADSFCAQMRKRPESATGWDFACVIEGDHTLLVRLTAEQTLAAGNGKYVWSCIWCPDGSTSHRTIFAGSATGFGSAARRATP